MSDQRREITLSLGTGMLALLALSGQCSMTGKLDRMADTADLQLCIEALKVEADVSHLSQCKDFVPELSATPAKATEARRAETGTGSVHDGAVAQPFAQTITPGESA